MEVCNCSMFCCTLLYVHSSIAIILMGKRELIALLNLSSWCLVMVKRLFLAVPWGCLQFVIVVFPDHTHLLFWKQLSICVPIDYTIIMRVTGLPSIYSKSRTRKQTYSYLVTHQPKHSAHKQLFGYLNC